MKTGGRLIRHARYYWLLLARGAPDPAAVRGMLQKIAALLSPADKASEKAEQIAMTTPERREKCWQNRVANRHFRPLQYLLDAKPPPSGAAGNPSTNAGRHLAEERRSIHGPSWNRRVKVEIPVYI